MDFFINEYNRIFTVKLMWSICQPFVCGTLEKVVEYALQPNNGIEGFYELTTGKPTKVSKKELKQLLSPELQKQLFSKY